MKMSRGERVYLDWLEKKEQRAITHGTREEWVAYRMAIVAFVAFGVMKEGWGDRLKRWIGISS